MGRSMASGVSFEILDLRHFTAPLLKPLLEAEGEIWRQRLHWDYQNSAKLLMQYLDSHLLPGYAALDAGRVTGYTFCVYEENKAVIGDVFAEPGLGTAGLSGGPESRSGHELEATLLRHLFETLQNSPQVDRIESQLLLHPSGAHTAVFRQAGFDLFPRYFMVQPLDGFWSGGHVDLPSELETRPWRDEDLNAASRLIAEAYGNHPDSIINDQYRSTHGAMRFLHNIVRYAGCGTFAPQVSHVILDRFSKEMIGLVLGSRVSPESGHITQLCVRPRYRRRGLGRMLLWVAAGAFLRLGVREISLTVTEANASAIEIYRAQGYECRHIFDAAVWQRARIA